MPSWLAQILIQVAISVVEGVLNHFKGSPSAPQAAQAVANLKLHAKACVKKG